MYYKGNKYKSYKYKSKCTDTIENREDDCHEKKIPIVVIRNMMTLVLYY